MFLLGLLFAMLPAIKEDLAPETVHGEQQDYSEKNLFIQEAVSDYRKSQDLNKRVL